MHVITNSTDTSLSFLGFMLNKSKPTNSGVRYVKRINSNIHRYDQHEIKHLEKYYLHGSIVFKKTFEDNQFMLRSRFLNLYSYGKTLQEAEQMMIEFIEDLYQDLCEDDDYSPEYKRIKRYLDKKLHAK